jgi:Fur family ferric uptake transcriptional regulator
MAQHTHSAADELDVHAVATTGLRRDQQRYTSGRRALVDALLAADRPMTIPELLAGRPQLAQSSAYRNLTVLERAGVVRRIVTSDDHARFELAEELTGHHHHLICVACGRVDDFHVSTEGERALEAALHAAVEAIGFRADHHRLDLVGTCSRCA